MNWSWELVETDGIQRERTRVPFAAVQAAVQPAFRPPTKASYVLLHVLRSQMEMKYPDLDLENYRDLFLDYWTPRLEVPA